MFKFRGTKKDQFVANTIDVAIEHYQMYTHDHVTTVTKVAKANYQVHGFNDDGLWVRQVIFFWHFGSSLNILGHIDVD